MVKQLLAGLADLSPGELVEIIIQRSQKLPKNSEKNINITLTLKLNIVLHYQLVVKDAASAN